jgi:signal transduction histidine kinase/response regulator of citrate/malate metabolism
MILMDALMPVVDGFTCCDRLTQAWGDTCPPILMITALDDRAAVDRAFQAGATDYITKPIHWAVLRQRVRRLLQAYWNTTELHRKMERERRLVAQLEAANSNLEGEVAKRTQDLQRALEFEALLKRITDKVRESLQEDQILHTVVQELARGVNLGSCNVGFFEGGNDSYGIRYEFARTLPSFQGHRVEAARHPDAFACLARGQCIYHLWDHPLRGRVVLLGCPLQDEDTLLGVLNLIRDPSATFTEPEIRLAQQVANHCAIAIRQARLYQAARQQIVELWRLNQLKDDFLSTVSHELRTPLASMRLALRMLKQAPTPEKQELYFLLLEEQCEREIHLVDDMLTLQQLSADGGAVEVEIIDANVWLTELIASFTATAQAQQLRLYVNLPDSAVRFHSDSTYLTRVVRELLTNACKYTEPNGQIAVELMATSSSAGESGISIVVKNTGSIASDQIPHLFEKFYRIPRQDRWGQGGTGLGLALVKRIVNHLNGEVTVQSQGGWIRFDVWLPGSIATDSLRTRQGRSEIFSSPVSLAQRRA